MHFDPNSSSACCFFAPYITFLCRFKPLLSKLLASLSITHGSFTHKWLHRVIGRALWSKFNWVISKQRLTCYFCAAYVFPCLFKATDLEAICIVVHSIHYARFTHGSSGQKCYFRKWNNLLETKAKTYFCLMHSMTFSFPALSLFLSLAAPVFLVFISVFLTVPLKQHMHSHTVWNIYPSTQPVFSLPSQAQVFLNQLYKTPVELNLEKNPDLRAIRFASFNPILDPWIYILLRKAVLLALIEKIKCLFCKIGARRQQRQGNFPCIDAHQLSSVISKRDSNSTVSRDLRDLSSCSQIFLYLPEGSDVYAGSCHKADRLSGSQASSVRNSQASYLSEQGSVEAQSRDRTNVTRDLSALPCPKDPDLQVSLSTETFEEKCIWFKSVWGEFVRFLWSRSPNDWLLNLWKWVKAH